VTAALMLLLLSLSEPLVGALELEPQPSQSQQHENNHTHNNNIDLREFALLHQYDDSPHELSSAHAVHTARIPVTAMWDVYDTGDHKATSATGDDGHAVPVSFPHALGAIRPPQYSEELVRRIKEDAENFLVNPPSVDSVEAGSVIAYGWPGLSQAGLDLMAFDRFFFGIADGVILESGALDGLSFSISWFFERFANWTAIHVEAGQANYDKLVANRPLSVNVNAALCASPKSLHYVGGDNAISGIYEFMDAAYIEKFHPDLHAQPDKAKDLPILSCLPAKLLFAALGLKRIDIWVLDVEGAELDVLHGVDWTAVNIRTIIMECDGTDTDRDHSKRGFLATKGYGCGQVLGDCVCRQDSFVNSTGGVYDGYPFSVSKGGHEIFMTYEGYVRSFANYDDYLFYLEECEKNHKSKARKEMKRVYFDTHPRGPPMGRPALKKVCGSS
jgi:hypothetical protein